MTYDTDPAAAGDTKPVSTDDPEERVERLTEEIDETRDGLTETIQAIGDKLEPGNIARGATDSVVATTRGKVDQMTYGAQETWRDVTSNPGNIIDTIKSNPVPAGMVGLGLAMLMMNRGKQSQDRRYGMSGAGLPGLPVVRVRLEPPGRPWLHPAVVVGAAAVGAPVGRLAARPGRSGRHRGGRRRGRGRERRRRRGRPSCRRAGRQREPDGG